MPELILIVIRSIIAFLLLFIMTRIMGKKQISQLTFFDYCVGITIGSIAATMSVDQNVKALNGLVSLFIWGIFPIVLAYAGMKSLKFSNITDGQPAVIIDKGKILEKNLKKNLMNLSELMLLLREKGVFHVSDVEQAVFETNGELSIMLKSEQQPVTPKTLGISVAKEHGPTILIMDGKIMKKSLEHLGYSKLWLLQQIQQQGAKNEKDVFLAQMDSKGRIYVDLYQNVNETNKLERPVLSEILTNIHAELEGFARQTDDPNAKQIYTKQANNLKEKMDKILPYI